ncbi:MAG: NTP transferase domain-containing protein [Deltaproteobacteria bacterium]|nr:NTP transferase domain-containing protein [Deltaproteobacteria bacterium]
MTILVPMAGAGVRFSREGYELPKPLLPVSGLPMAVQATKALPSAADMVFVCQRDHVDRFGLDRVLESHFPGCRVVVLDHMTQGQACTCLEAEAFVDSEAPLTIGACDNSMLWNRESFDRLRADPDTEAMIWTFRNNAAVSRNPRGYGWVRTDEHDNALGISCKIPISDNPLQDHAIVGTFWFRKASLFFDAVKRQMAEGLSTNGEYYVDVTMEVLIKAGVRVKVFEVDHYVCWGTPDDLRTYEYWESYFLKVLRDFRDHGERAD